MGDFTTSADEMLAVVDDNDNSIGKARRKEIHKKGLLHREVFVYIINSQKQVLIQKRAEDQCWDHSVGGHFPAEQDYLEAAQRETEEELGVRLDRGDFEELGKERLEKLTHEKINRRFAKIFIVRKDIPLGDFKIDRGEVAEIRYFSKKELIDFIDSGEPFMDSAITVIKKYILPIL